MTDTLTVSAVTDIDVIADVWIAEFAKAVSANDIDSIVSLFAAESWWRDAVSLSWDIRTMHGEESMRTFLGANLAAAELSGFRLWSGAEPTYTDTGNGGGYVQAFIEFRTRVGWGIAVVRLVSDVENNWVAWTLMTSLQELDGHELAAGSNRPVGERVPTTTWADHRRKVLEFADADPEVMILGAGQSGMAAAAYLGLMGIKALVIERNASVGDNWRNRYASLVLHDPIWADSLPFMQFPETWPVYTPRDKVADWFEIYEKALDLNIWTSTELVSSSYSDDEGLWTVEVRRNDGTTRTLRPKQFIFAVGLLTEPNMPELEGLKDFQGEVRHTSGHPGGKGWEGKKALVVGVCNSGQDVAKDLHDHGADVTMLQRSPTYVITQEKGLPIVYGGLYDATGPETRVADLMNLATPFSVTIKSAGQMATRIAELDRELLDGLTAAGFRLDDGVETGGMVGLGLLKGGGFLLDVGSCDLIVDGRIKIEPGEIRRLTENGAELSNGTFVEADVIVFATGYKNMRESARRILGDSVADRCKPVWGLDEEGELNTMWRPSGHPGFWFTGGSFAHTRIYTRFLALQIAAQLRGIAN
ncbi:flavin-containing monooxygenase [Rhodococcus opacus]|uniref:flavin-containing monooxygenase n=1 Tax=Rhodococcus opacus TaxID=37919 RepID=UPI002235517A|nr:NAD(P)/FAD-dependent oxidoreductase [Rhodococcus opacus]UZG59905.1 NAD(P)/FAD-dependent oxidoreductase [Rhodococcus opacus]